MTDEPEDTKTDRVISMAEFRKSERESKDGPSGMDAMTPNEVLEYMKQYQLQTVVILGQQSDGSFRFGGNIADVAEVVYLLEAYKKIIIDSSVGIGYK